MKSNRTLLWGMGGILFASVVLGQYQLFQKRESEMKKYFSLILNEKKSLQNHVQYLENREEQLLTRVNLAEAKIDTINK